MEQHCDVFSINFLSRIHFISSNFHVFLLEQLILHNSEYNSYSTFHSFRILGRTWELLKHIFCLKNFILFIIFHFFFSKNKTSFTLFTISTLVQTSSTRSTGQFHSKQRNHIHIEVITHSALQFYVEKSCLFLPNNLTFLMNFRNSLWLCA